MADQIVTAIWSVLGKEWDERLTLIFVILLYGVSTSLAVNLIWFMATRETLKLGVHSTNRRPKVCPNLETGFLSVASTLETAEEGKDSRSDVEDGSQSENGGSNILYESRGVLRSSAEESLGHWPAKSRMVEEIDKAIVAADLITLIVERFDG